MRDGFACHLAHVQNLAAAGSGKGRRGDQAKLPVIPSVIEEFAIRENGRCAVKFAGGFDC